MSQEYDHPVKGQGFTTEYAAAVIVFGSLLFLIMVRRGFRGVSAGGVGISIK
jgi:hypothetical protein